MSYCEKCGAMVSEGALFCANCGNRINNGIIQNTNTVQFVSNTDNERIQTAQQLSEIYDYFECKGKLYDEYDRLTWIINTRKGFKMREAVVLVLAIIIDPLILYGALMQKEIWILILALPLPIAFVYMIVNRKRQYNNAIERYAVVSKDLSDHYEAYGYCPIGIELTNPKIIHSIADKVRQGRAYSIKEAINIMFEDAHRDRMEMLASETAASAASAAHGANVAAVFCAASFFLK